MLINLEIIEQLLRQIRAGLFNDAKIAELDKLYPLPKTSYCYINQPEPKPNWLSKLFKRK